MNQKISENLNKIIISMAIKQELLNNLESEFIKVNIYQKYIDNLIEINLKIMDLERRKEKYKKLINLYIEGEIKEPNKILYITFLVEDCRKWDRSFRNEIT